MSADISKTRSSPTAALFPGWIARLIIAVTLSFVVVIRLLGRTQDPPRPLNDPAMCNLLTLIFTFVAALTAWIWFCFWSGYSLRARRVVFFGTFAVIAAAFGLFRFIEFSGSMVPRFAPRWQAAAPDRQLGQLDLTPAAAIDIATTSPDDFPQFLGPQRTCWLPGPE